MKKKFFASLAVALMSVFGLANVNMALAAGGSCPNGGTYQNSIAECGLPSTPSGTPDDLETTAGKVINVAIGVVAFVAVVVMIIGGVFFIISQGDAAKITRARHTIMYGLIGLVIAMLSFAIVNFVLKNVF